MSCVQTLFHKKSRGSLRRKHTDEERSFAQHARTMSVWSQTTASSSSSTVSTGSHRTAASYDPLSLHPPMSLNASPKLVDFDEDVFPDVREQHDDSTEDMPEASPYSPLSEGSYYFNQDARRRTYVYDQQIQWPLKDWQAVPPGLADVDNVEGVKRQTTSRTVSSTSISSHRRPPKEAMNELDMFVKRGEWKRRGIVFGLGSDEEEDQMQHFELPG
ncbi:hypothetical protein BJ170DRAFT_498040 [Xylariales sp. AK1849]|nr:hypothetical protein BJ170DRAFT_498040 [Xylariales sp. AK1849]